MQCDSWNRFNVKFQFIFKAAEADVAWLLEQLCVQHEHISHYIKEPIALFYKRNRACPQNETDILLLI